MYLLGVKTGPVWLNTMSLHRWELKKDTREEKNSF